MTSDRVWLQKLCEHMLELLGPVDWGRVRDTVVRLQVSDLDGPQRRALATLELREMGVSLPTPILNLAIEATVVWASSPNGSPRTC